MKLETLQETEKNLMTELVRRRALGGYSADAESLIFLTEVMYRLVQHLVDTYPEEQAPVKRKAK